MGRPFHAGWPYHWGHKQKHRWEGFVDHPTWSQVPEAGRGTGCEDWYVKDLKLQKTQRTNRNGTFDSKIDEFLFYFFSGLLYQYLAGLLSDVLRWLGFFCYWCWVEVLWDESNLEITVSADSPAWTPLDHQPLPSAAGMWGKLARQWDPGWYLGMFPSSLTWTVGLIWLWINRLICYNAINISHFRASYCITLGLPMARPVNIAVHIFWVW